LPESSAVGVLARHLLGHGLPFDPCMRRAFDNVRSFSTLMLRMIQDVIIHDILFAPTVFS
jgi:hypothetical protein